MTNGLEKAKKLTELIERVRAATGPDREFDASIAELAGEVPEGALRMHGLPGAIKYATGAYEAWTTPDYTASIDAIVALIERKLPGWQYHMGSCGESDIPWACVTEPKDPCRDFPTNAPTIPLALIESFLIALQSIDTGGGEG